MQHSVDDVEQQFMARIPAVLTGDPFCGIHAYYDFTFEEVLGFGRIKADDVRRIIMVEELPIDSMDFRIVHNCQRYLAIVPTVVICDHFDGLDEERAGNATDRGTAMDLNRDSHGNLVRIGNDCRSQKIELSVNLFVLRKLASSTKGAYVRNPREERQN